MRTVPCVVCRAVLACWIQCAASTPGEALVGGPSMSVHAAPCRACLPMRKVPGMHGAGELGGAGLLLAQPSQLPTRRRRRCNCCCLPIAAATPATGPCRGCGSGCITLSDACSCTSSGTTPAASPHPPPTCECRLPSGTSASAGPLALWRKQRWAAVQIDTALGCTGMGRHLWALPVAARVARRFPRRPLPALPRRACATTRTKLSQAQHTFCCTPQRYKPSLARVPPQESTLHNLLARLRDATEITPLHQAAPLDGPSPASLASPGSW